MIVACLADCAFGLVSRRFYQLCVPFHVSYLHGNPLHCVCKLSWLCAFLRTVTEHRAQRARCATPAHLSGVAVRSLTVDQFACGRFPEFV